MMRPAGFPGKGFRPRTFCLAAAFVLSVPVLASPPPDWAQWGRNPQHTGAAPVSGQPLEAILADLVYDPFVAQMELESGGELLAHYAVPLIDGSDVYMAFKSGDYGGFGYWSSLTWSVTRLRWQNGTLTPVWTFPSDWKPEDLSLAGWEPVFQPALANGSLYVPGAGGTVFKVSKATGQGQRINPFASLDASIFVAGGLAAGADGTVVYDALRLDLGNPGADATGAWLVRVSPDGAVARADFAGLALEAPRPSDQCQATFPRDERPWPPTPSSVPPFTACGSLRPGVNVIPAIGTDGTIYTVGRSHFNDRYAYLLAVRPDLSPKWARSLRGILSDGCGVLVPIDGSLNGCRAGATVGVDPATNDRPAGRVNDAGTSSPAVLPDGGILLGTYAGYNGSRGHLFKIGADGGPLATFDFGWDITPAVYPHDGTYSILLKNNYYASGQYDVVSLDANLQEEWSLANTTDQDCVRADDGSVLCEPAGFTGFEWCVNQPAVDAAGVTYVNAEDGYLYAINRDGTLRERMFLNTAVGAAYTPVSIGPDGVVYAQNNGHLFAIGKARSAREEPRLLNDGRTTRAVARP